MLRALSSSTAGLLAQQIRVDIAANNVANVQTTGFKAGRASFGDLLSGRLEKEIVPLDGGAAQAQVGAGAGLTATLRDFAPGMPLETGRPLDLAIEGEGFFAVDRADGGERLYTRDGTFYIDAEGNLVTAGGDPVAPGIQVPEGALEVSVRPDGTVTALGAEGEPEELGRLNLYTFPNPGGLEARGGNLFAATAAGGEATEGLPGEDGMGTLRSGRLESSNVDLAAEMVTLIEAYRAFQVNARMVQTSDDMWGQANRLRD
ncbi:MAG: flagellar hook-basal body protein [Bacillota bacterium]|nr:flagellar hook-basal body protein [Bacillota bacterium]